MVRRKEELEDTEVKGIKPTFTKEQFKTSERYRYKQDLIEVILDPDIKYTVDEVDEMIKTYMESEAR